MINTCILKWGHYQELTRSSCELVVGTRATDTLCWYKTYAATHVIAVEEISNFLYRLNVIAQKTVGSENTTR